MALTQKRELLWRAYLPVLLFVPGLSGLTREFCHTHWHQLLVLLPRLVAFAVVLRGRLKLNQVALAWAIEVFACALAGWLFGRSFM